MPFQGNPNAGAPDPALINMLFQQKQRREELAWEREKYQQEAQRQAQLDAADQARKDRESRLKAAGLLFDIQSKVQDRTKTLGSAQADAEEQMGAVEQQYPVSDYAQPAFAPIEQRPAGLFPLEAPDLQNVGVQSQVASQLMEPIDAQRASIENTLADIPELESLRSSIPEQGNLSERLRARTAGIKAAEYDRQFGMQVDKEREAATTADNRSRSRMDKAARIAAAADTEKTLAAHRAIRDMGRAADAEKDPAARADKQAEVRALVEAREADMSRLQPDEAIKIREKTFSDMQEYRRQNYTINMLEKIDANPDLLGFQAPAIQALRTVVGSASEILDFVSPAVDRVLMDSELPQASRDRMEKIFIEHRNPETGAELTEAQLLEASIKWQLVMQVNSSGRVTQKQLNDYEKLTNFMDPFKPRAVSRDVVRGTIKFMQSTLRAVNRQGLRDRGILFEQDGRILGDDPYIWGQTQPQDDTVDPVNGPPVVSKRPIVDPVTGHAVQPIDPKILSQDPVLRRAQELRKARQSGSPAPQ